MLSAVRALRPARVFAGEGLMARVARSSFYVLFGYGASQFLRLLANLVLTRLLFPEAFGLMTLVTMVTVGLMLFSDLGIGPSIMQNKRGDDPAFLDTAWSIQVARGVILWLVSCLLSYPLAQFYDAPQLALYIPIASFALVIAGFNPTRIDTAYRHLQFGRVIMFDFLSQLVATLVMILLAWLTGSVMALVVGTVFQPLVRLVLSRTFLSGHRNRFRWEPAAARELIHFGKWIFMSTVFSFFASQGDKLVFGKYLSLETLGIYNIGYYLGSFPLLLAQTLVGRIMIPVYRDVAASGSDTAAHKLVRLRFLLTTGTVGFLMVLAYFGPPLVDFLYDIRYVHAGAMVVLIAVALLPRAISMSYDRAALAGGDSRRFFIASAASGIFQVLFLLVGAHLFGIVGAIAGMALAGVLVYPLLVWLAVTHRVWDWRHDAVFWTISALLAAGAIWRHLDEIRAMATAAG